MFSYIFVMISNAFLKDSMCLTESCRFATQKGLFSQDVLFIYCPLITTENKQQDYFLIIIILQLSI